MTPGNEYLAQISGQFVSAPNLVGEGEYRNLSGAVQEAKVGESVRVMSHGADGGMVQVGVFVWTGQTDNYKSGWVLYSAGSAHAGADAAVSSSPANQATSAPSADEGGVIAGGQAMSVQAAQSNSPQGAGGWMSMGAVRSGLEGASWFPGPVGSAASAALVGIDIYQGNYGQAAMGAVGIFGGRVATSAVRAARNTKIVTSALEKLSGAGAGLGTAFAGWAKGLSKLPRFHGPKPGYSVNPAHVAGRGLRPGKTPLPKDAEAAFKNAVPNDPTSPTAWFARNSEGQIYRYSIGGDGTAHFSGIHGVGDGTRNVTSYAVERLDGL